MEQPVCLGNLDPWEQQDLLAHLAVKEFQARLEQPG